ncbi:MAG: CehA/McbA family metallohydrolase [Pyrinomonadaceae bacterium]
MRMGRRRRWLKLALALFVALLITQTPFIYRRYKLGRLAATIAQLNAQRSINTDDAYADYKGALHVHSSLGGHSTGTLADIIQAARANSLAFVVMTEHPATDMDTAAQTLSGLHGGVLFIAGNETNESADDRLLTFGRDARTIAAPPGASTQDLIDQAKQAGQLVFIAHPETFRSWQTARGFDGMEVYNLHANAKQINRLTLFFDGLWSYHAYPHLLWTRFYETPSANLRRWDELTIQGRRVVAIAGNDAHANVGLSLQQLTGKPILQLKLDPYERSFQVVRTHVLIAKDQPLDTASLLSAFSHGHAYVAFDIMCDATGFRFTAEGGGRTVLMGDMIVLADDGLRLRAAALVESRIVLIKDGIKFAEVTARQHEWVVTQPGVYRIECYLPQLGAPLDQKPWIISNPIYVWDQAH